MTLATYNALKMGFNFALFYVSQTYYLILIIIHIYFTKLKNDVDLRVGKRVEIELAVR